MKISILAAVAVRACAFAVAPAEESAQLKQFGSELGEAIRWNEAKKEILTIERDKRAHLGAFVKRLRSLKVDGLPEDLRAAFSAFVTGLSDYHAMAEKSPLDPADELAMPPEKLAAVRKMYQDSEDRYLPRMQTFMDLLKKYKVDPLNLDVTNPPTAASDEQKLRLKQFEAELSDAMRRNESNPEARTNEKVRIAELGQLLNKLKAMKVDDLPEDLRTAFTTWLTALTDYHVIAEKAPKDAVSQAALQHNSPEQFAAFQILYAVAQESYLKRMQKFLEELAKYKIAPVPADSAK